jgi:hypothetical protein
MKTCPDCGCRVYNLGCVNCNEADYIEEQNYFDEVHEAERRRERETDKCGENA